MTLVFFFFSFFGLKEQGWNVLYEEKLKDHPKSWFIHVNVTSVSLKLRISKPVGEF